MNFTVGIDIVKNKRLLNKSERFYNHFLTQDEIIIFKKISNKDAKISFLGGRWASKEAIIKALDKNINFHDIEILNDESGRPIVKLRNILIKNINLSISHEKKYSIAFCILDKNILEKF